jgi:Sec-independent protein translocase protein TatA
MGSISIWHWIIVLLPLAGLVIGLATRPKRQPKS